MDHDYSDVITALQQSYSAHFNNEIASTLTAFAINMIHEEERKRAALALKASPQGGRTDLAHHLFV